MLTKRVFAWPARFLARSVRFNSNQHQREEIVLMEEVNNNGLLVLNRPEYLNAFNVEMMQKIRGIVSIWKDSKSLIVIRGKGRAFCAGGDIRAITESDQLYGVELCGIEYPTNYLIGTMKIPFVALIDGITMGGGVGFAVHGKYRVATERTVFAMPETSIGLYPDIGASYFLPRLQGKLGYYLGLTGSRLIGADVIKAGIATHYCESKKIPDLERSLLNLENPNDVDGVINDFWPKTQLNFKLEKHLDQINECFDASTVEEILENLVKDGSEWAKNTIKVLWSCSPTSLKLTFRLLNMGANLSLRECLQLDYRLACNMSYDINCDFHEGVRALIISKDGCPKWDPARLEDMTEQHVLRYFKNLPNDDVLPIAEKIKIPIEN